MNAREIVYPIILVGLVSAFILLMLTATWVLFEGTELWEMIKDWLEKRKES